MILAMYDIKAQAAQYKEYFALPSSKATAWRFIKNK